MTNAARILIVDDDLPLLDLYAAALSNREHLVTKADSAEAALRALDRDRFELAVIDYRLPGKSGVEVIRRLHETVPDTAIIVISGYPDRELTREAVGSADRYLPKPFELEELFAAVDEVLTLRAQGNLRRQRWVHLPDSGAWRAAPPPSPPTDSPTAIQVGDLTVDVARHQAWRGRVSLDLTAVEMRMLHCLLQHHDQVVDHETLAHVIRSTNQRRRVDPEKSLPRYIHALRQKLEPHPSRPIYIHTVRASGYKITPKR
jgi:DNA-binding response OmpR family regulator